MMEETLRKQILSQNPTTEQTEAIFSNDKEFLLRASPGSGKTWTSCRRFIWRGANWEYKVGGLALLSFTNTAIKEFEEATIKVGRRNLLTDPNFVGTFDSFVERFLITPFGHLAQDLKRRPKLHISPKASDWANNKLMAWQNLSGGRKQKVPAWEIIPYPKEGNLCFKSSLNYGGKDLSFQFHNPVHEFFKIGYYTHAQRVYLAYKILSKYDRIANCIWRRFPEIIVDEAQDTNIWLLILLNLLRKKGSKITLVGDPDQCIYEFSMARADSLIELKKQWKIPEKPLNKSFRCNNNIASAVKNIGTNPSLVGSGEAKNQYCSAFIYRETSDNYSNSITKIQNLTELAGLSKKKISIICRANKELENLRGESIYHSLQGITKKIAEAAFVRDEFKNYRRAYEILYSIIKEIIDIPTFWDKIEENPEDEDAYKFKLTLWKFIKSSEGLPSISLDGNTWIDNVRTNLASLLKEIGFQSIPPLGRKIRKNGLKATQLSLPLFEPEPLFPNIRSETIHKVKGETIDSVLLLGSTRFFNDLVKSIENSSNTEERRIAYVGMTRAKHCLLIGLPSSHFDSKKEFWLKSGFQIIN